MESKHFSDMDLGLSGECKKDLFGDPVSSQDVVPPKEIDDFLSDPITVSSKENSSKVQIGDLLEDFNDEFSSNEKDFKFEKPLPPEPIDSTADFLKKESNYFPDAELHKNLFDLGDDVRDSTPSPARDFDTPSPAPPLVSNYKQPDIKREDTPSSREDSPLFKGKESPNFREESPERFEPPKTPEPEVSPFKPVAEFKDDIIETTKKPELEHPKQAPPPTPFVKRKHSVEDIGAKDIRVKIDAWFNPARLHPAVESLVYWRDPKKSGVVFGVIMLTLISLTLYSLISVLAYLCLITVLCTISFRVYKSIMQAVQKTSDGHPFKEFLDIDLTIPEDKVKDVSLAAVQYVNSSVATLRSLFLVEDIIDSIKFSVILWVLTYVGACFNGLTLIIIGVILLFTLPKVYENNKAQIDVYIKIAMDKLSIITNKVKTIVPESKKEEKPKDQ